MSSSVLFVTTYPPGRGELGGGGWVDRRLLAALRFGSLDVRVATTTDEVERANTADQVVHVGRAPLSIREDKSRLGRVALAMMTSPKPYQELKFTLFDDVRATRVRLQKQARGRDVITSGFSALMFADLADVPISTHIVHNLEWQVAASHAPLPLKLLGEAPRLRHREFQLLRRPRRVLALSRHDASALVRAGFGATQMHLPLTIRGCHRRMRPDGLRIGFIGTLHWPPNSTALRILLTEVLPAVRERVPEATVVVAGRGSESVERGPSAVSWMGLVEDVADFYDNVDVVVVPRYGPSTGISVKVLEATEHDTMAIVSPEVAHAITRNPPWLMGRAPEDIASAITRFAHDPADDMRRLREWARTREALAPTFTQLLGGRD